MEVGAEDVLVAGSLGPVLTVIAFAFRYFPQRTDALLEEGTPIVVLKPFVRIARFLIENRDIADKAVVLLAQRVMVQRANARDFPTSGIHVVVTQQLVATTNGQHDAVPFNVLLEISGFGLDIFRDDELLIILSAPEEDKVIFLRVECLAEADNFRLHCNAFLTGAILEHEQVAVIAIRVQEVSIQVTDFQFHLLLHPFGNIAFVCQFFTQVQDSSVSGHDIYLLGGGLLEGID